MLYEITVHTLAYCRASKSTGALSARGFLHEAKEIVGRCFQKLAHPVDQGESWLDLGALVAGVAVLLDPEGPRELAGVREAPFGSQLTQAPGELQANRWRCRIVRHVPSVNDMADLSPRIRARVSCRMQGAQSFARIILNLPEVDLDVVRRDEAFDDILLWLAQWRGNALVDAAYQRLIGTIN